jgi:Ca2+-binding RTX toxin-like protein
MPTSSARPADLLAFEQTTSTALGELYDPSLTLMEKLEAVRSNAQAQQFLPSIPYIGQEVLDLYSIGRHLARWVGDVGRAFQNADGNGDGVVDDVLLGSVPRLGNGTFTVMRVNGRVVVDTGDGDDQVSVVNVPGGVRITVNGVSQVITGAEASSIILRLGGGNDSIEVDTDVDVHFTLEGQDGSDVLEAGAGNDTIYGGEGRDYVDGFSGDDVLDGGDGHDVIYAGDGNDTVSGGSGVDYLEGGAGDDTLLGGRDHDILSGGDGADRLDGQAGGDVIYTGAGSDRATDHQGSNTIYGQPIDDVWNPIEGSATNWTVIVDLSGLPGDAALQIDPDASPRFRQRIMQDLQMLRSSPDGRAMLLAMDDIHNDTKAIAADWPVLGGIAYQGDTITISEYPGRDNSSSSYESTLLGRENEISQSRNIVEMYPGSYTPDPHNITWQEAPPVAIFFHELAHQYDFGYETSMDGDYQEPGGPVPNDERQAVGLPVDHDGDPNTPEIVDPDHPHQYTENGLRDEMGLPDRTTYGHP